GVSVRAQCETFMAAAITAAFLCLARSRVNHANRYVVAAGVLFGLAFIYKYNAAAYVFAGLFALIVWDRFTVGAIIRMAVGFLIPVAAFAAWFALGQGLSDLYDATIMYNVRYSGETYAGWWHALTYLFTFPVLHARVDALWLVGGAGCAILLVAARRDAVRLVPVAWTAAACLTIAINGSRDLPQYFVQAAPALALAAAWGAMFVRTRFLLMNVAIAVAVLVAVYRVDDFNKLAENTWHDARYVLGRTTWAEHLARYGDRSTRKYSAQA